jgi:ketosteroid isomerase-like protein
MPTIEESLRVADQLTEAFRQRSVEGFEKLYADDAVIWHAATNQCQNKQENIGLLRQVFALMSQIGYEEITRFPTPDGFFQSQVVRGTFTDGVKIPELHSCFHITVRDGKIAKLREWFSAPQFDEVWKRMGVAV